MGRRRPEARPHHPLQRRLRRPRGPHRRHLASWRPSRCTTCRLLVLPAHIRWVDPTWWADLARRHRTGALLTGIIATAVLLGALLYSIATDVAG